LASTISRDDIIAVIGASSSPVAAGGLAETALFGLVVILQALPTKRAGAKPQIVDIVIDLPFTLRKSQSNTAAKARSGGSGHEYD
jgi:hypothetical protein